MDALVDELSERWEKSPLGIQTRANLFITKKIGLSQGTWIHLDLVVEIADRSRNSGFEVNSKSDLFVIRKGGLSQGTCIYPDLVVEFGRWLDPKFAIWYDRIIKKIMTGEYTVQPSIGFKDPVAAARAWANAEEGKQISKKAVTVLQVQAKEAKPMINYTQHAATLENSVSITKWSTL